MDLLYGLQVTLSRSQNFHNFELVYQNKELKCSSVLTIIDFRLKRVRGFIVILYWMHRGIVQTISIKDWKISISFFFNPQFDVTANGIP